MYKRLFGWVAVIALVLTLTLTHTVNVSIGHGSQAEAASVTGGAQMDTEQIAAQLGPAVVTVINNQQTATQQSARGTQPGYPGRGSNGNGNGGNGGNGGISIPGFPSRGSNGSGNGGNGGNGGSNGSGNSNSSSPVPTGLGSGVIFDKQGDILTNNHVVEGATSLTVELADGTQVDATLVGRDPSQDVAVVKIDPSKVPAVAQLGDSSSVKAGEPVVALGSPEAFTNSVTAGIVSGVNRQVDTYAGLIQTDTAINHGNSGGPLVNAQGQVIGLNTLGLASDGDQGLNFAIPINTAKQVAQTVMAKGNGAVVNSRSYLGVSVDSLSSSKGAVVSQVQPGTPADKAGVQAGDIITAVNGTTLDSTTTLGSMLGTLKPGDTVKLTVNRNGSTQTLTATLAEYPSTTDTQTP
jgi:S1-C subfamily serine protease